MEKKLNGIYTRMLVSDIEQVLETVPHKTAAVPPHTTRHENYQN